MKTIYSGLPAEWHKASLYDWGRRGLRTRYGQRLPGALRKRCTWDARWNQEFVRVSVPGGALIRLIGRLTSEWVAVHQKRGKFWRVGYYLVPRFAYLEAERRMQTSIRDGV